MAWCVVPVPIPVTGTTTPAVLDGLVAWAVVATVSGVLGAYIASSKVVEVGCCPSMPGKGGRGKEPRPKRIRFGAAWLKRPPLPPASLPGSLRFCVRVPAPGLRSPADAPVRLVLAGHGRLRPAAAAGTYGP